MSDKGDAARFRWLIGQAIVEGRDMVDEKWHIYVDKAGAKNGAFYDHGSLRKCIDRARGMAPIKKEE